MAKRLGYVPSPVARALGSGPTSTVGVVTSDLEGRFALPILMGVEDALGTDSVLTFLCDARGDDVRERRLVDMLLKHRVDGIVLVGRQTDPRVSLGPLPVPVVYAYSESESPDDCSVTVDNAAIGRIAGEHLVGLGKRNIAHISGEPGHSAAILRLAGFTEVLERTGLELARPPLFGLWTEGWGRAAMELLLDSGTPLDAVFCASDQLAIGALDTLYERGLRVPDDIAILGVDNWEVLAENARVPLTSIDMSLKRVGRLAAQRVMEAAAGRPSRGREVVQGRLVHRKSTIPSR
ncbi:MAG: LacI family DNA-binding transcriptional regulator [Arachnia sp.]